MQDNAGNERPPTPITAARRAPDPGRIPPHNIEAEESLLGACLLAPDAIRAAHTCQLTASSFYRPQHAHIWAAIDTLHTNQTAIDIITVGEELRRNGHLDHVGGLTRLREIQAATPASANAPHYAQIIADLAHHRDIITTSTSITDATYTGQAIDDLVARLNVPTAGRTLTPVDLGPILDGTPPEVTPTIWRRTDGHPIIYPARLATFHCEPSGGKTWCALAICAEQLPTRPCIYIDFEADPNAIIERLRALHVPDDTIRENFWYIRPGQPFTNADRHSLAALASHAAIIVIDTLAAALALHGLDESSNPEVLAFLQTTIRPLTKNGAAVILLDHVVKDKDTRGRWARGASAKLGEVDTAYSIRPMQPFSRTRDGHLRLRLEKDRYGAIGTERATIADIHVTVTDNGHNIRLQLDPPAGHDQIADELAPTRAMQAISELLESAGVPLSKNMLEQGIPYAAATARRASAELVRTGHVVIEQGPRGSVLHRLIRPYQQHDNTTQNDQYDDDEY